MALQRVSQRSRGEENKITLEYLSDIHSRHEEWLIEEKFPLPAPVFVVDANKDLDGIKMQFLSQKDKVVADLLRVSDEKETESHDKGHLVGQSLEEATATHCHRVGDGYFCSLCGMTVKDLYAAKNHMEAKHYSSGESYSCEICHKQFATRNAYFCHKSRCMRKLRNNL